MKKQELIQKYLKEPIKAGDVVYVKGLGSKNEEAFNNTTTVLEVGENDIVYKDRGSIKRVGLENVKKRTYEIGANPFKPYNRNIQTVNYNLDSVLFKLGILKGTRKENYTTKKGFNIKVTNFDPFVELNGTKQYYQRPLVWTLEDKQNLIHSIYNNLSCGKILIRERSFDWQHSRDNKEDCYWYDIVDGKQRLSTLKEFLNNEFADRNGNYYEDLSDLAQHRLTDHQLFTYQEMGENTTDEEVLEQFLLLNFAGVPQSTEHLSFVEKLLKYEQ